MGLIDIIIILIAAIIFISVVIFSLLGRKKGKNSCGCNCKECLSCSTCNVVKNKNNSCDR